MNKSEIEESAYRWVGSAPCEDCHKFKECGKSEFECNLLKTWKNDYNTMLKEFERLYESKT